MREKRVNLVVLTCSVIVATCASLSYCFVTAPDTNHHLLDKYVAVISSAIVPLFLSGHISTASAATVWIPTEEAIDTDGNVKDEFQEVAHVFARPGVKVVKPRDEDELTHLPVPWTSLKNEWKIYQKIQSSHRTKPATGDVLGKKKGNGLIEVNTDDDQGSSEEEEEDDGEAGSDEEDEEEDEPEGRSGVVPPPPMPPQQPNSGEAGSEERKGPADEPTPSQVAQAKTDSLPLAFYGQQNHDDDEKDYLKDEQNNFSKKKKANKSDEDSEEHDVSASIEDYNDYALENDDDGDEDDEEKGSKNNNKKDKDIGFDEIPLAIREMILNDLANQNNGSGYTPNLTPQVTGGGGGGGGQSGGSSASVENDENSGEDNSSEEEEDDKAPIDPLGPTPPAIREGQQPKKGDDDDDDDVNDEDEGGKGKGKGKGKKGKKGKKGGGGGWGKKKPGWGWQPPIHHPPPKGWGWDPVKHDGVLEQLVRGSTWERVLKYYHWKRDQSVHEEGEHHHDDHDDHKKGGHSDENPGLEFAGVLHPPVGWGEHNHHPEGKIKKLVRGAFKGSFWERAVQTYAKYKENQAKNPKSPTLVDLDTDGFKMDLKR